MGDFVKIFPRSRKSEKGEAPGNSVEFENLKMKSLENIGEFFTHLKAVINEMKRNGESLDDVRVI